MAPLCLKASALLSSLYGTRLSYLRCLVSLLPPAGHLSALLCRRPSISCAYAFPRTKATFPQLRASSPSWLLTRVPWITLARYWCGSRRAPPIQEGTRSSNRSDNSNHNSEHNKATTTSNTDSIKTQLVLTLDRMSHRTDHLFNEFCLLTCLFLRPRISVL